MRASPLPRVAALAVLALLAVVLPLVITALEPALLANSYGRESARFELLAGFAALVAGFAAALELRARRPRTAAELTPVLAPLLVALLYTFLIGEYSRKPFDYDCYEYAGRAILLGEDPYRVGLIYLYPPLTAQLFALSHALLASAAELAGIAADPETIWNTVFYLFQCEQLAGILLLYALATRFARAVGMEATAAAATVALLLLIDNPLLRSVRHGQINVWVLDLALLSALYARRLPPLSGFALALSIHLKLYPLVLLLPLALARCGRAVLWTAVGFATIVLLQTDLGRDWTPWRQFADFYSRVYPGEVAIRNSSFHAIAWNTLRLLFDLPPASLRTPVRLAASVFSLAMGFWLLLRSRRRARTGDDALLANADDALLANAADALAFSLLISQSVWEHHFLFALPLVILAVAWKWRERPLPVAICAFLVLGMPTFDLYPLSYHRLAGLIGLLVLTRPEPEARS